MNVERPFFVARPHLDDRIARALSGRIALARGGFGAGKSAAVTDFLTRTGTPFVRYALPEGETSIVEFTLGLADALAPFAHGSHPLRAIAGELVEANRNPGLALVAWLNAHLAAAGMTLVIDTVGDARDVSPIADLLATLASETDERLRWCFVGRDLAALPVASWLAHRAAALPLESADLAFSDADITALAQLRNAPLSASALHELGQRVSRHPLTVSWALDVLRTDAEVTRLPEGVDAGLDVLATLTLTAMSPGERAFIAATCVLPDLAADVVAALPVADSSAALARLMRAYPALFLREAPLRYQPEIRRRLARLTEASAAERDAQLRAAAQALERADRSDAALRLLVETGDAEAVAGVLRRDGLALAERGAWGRIDPALQCLEGTAFADEPLLLALRAASESNREHFDTAEAWFRLALDTSAGSFDASPIAHRFALEAMRRGRTDIVEALARPLLEHADATSETAPAMRATLATAYAVSEDHERARHEIELALGALHSGVAAKERARILQQAAFVSVRAGAYEGARTLASDAFEQAVEAGAYNVAALAQTLLYEIAIEADDDLDAALRHLEEFARYAVLSGGERLHLFALLATFSVHVERGDLEAMERVEHVLRGRALLQYTSFVNETLLADEALRAAWHGEFERAWRLIAGTVAQETGARRSLRTAEIAVYAAAGGRHAEAREALEQAAGWDELPLAARSGRIPGLIALADVLLGDEDGARGVVARARAGGAHASSRNAALLETVDVLLAYREDDGAARMLAALDTLRERGLGGLARLITALPATSLPV